jgi:hypothetical protein
MSYTFTYLPTTVEHCMIEPTPRNVRIAYKDEVFVVYTVDLPASVWAAVSMPVHDPNAYSLNRFPSPSLRDDHVDELISSHKRAAS